MSLRLHQFHLSSASYRVRIALNLKGQPYESLPVDLRGAGQFAPAFSTLNPAQLVPVLEHDGEALTQSLAIIEYLEEVHPMVPLLPQDAVGRARVRALAQTIACDTHPLMNLRVLKHLKGPMGLSEEQKMDWYYHWMGEGMKALEAHLERDEDAGRFCYGDTPTIADCCLVPQVYNAQRFEIDLAPYPNVARIAANCADLPAFMAAHPSAQPDSE